ncbi:hypothetical protein SEUCBS139899_008425 [Sporothrix eucalyptigena]|uniref:Uncharacterized protein n=1 Tax=Sporothrix eucalyptigena TaxID=1812306 RepID=A0ABP0CC40_9PEZI
METLQLAQMLADLSDLDAAEPRAAHALVTANTTITTTTSTVSSTTVQQSTSTTTIASPSTQAPAKPHQHRRVSSSSALSPGGSGSRNGGSSTPFDSYLGRRLLTPPITRSSSSHGSIPGTPRGNETDSDVDRASSLMALYDLRAKLKQYNDSNSLRQAREKVAALSGRQQQLSSQPSADNLAGAASPVQPPPMARRHSQYTFPRS